MSDWISVNYRLPKEDGRYLVYGVPTCCGCNPDWRVREARFIVEEGGCSNYFEFGEYDCSIEVTHWMPMPEPPLELETKNREGI